jgi:XTP/dITP diphosphohydrolase
MHLVVATNNPDKFREIAAILGDAPLTLRQLSEWPDYLPPEETGATLEDNAILKAQDAASFTGLPAVADDTGLEVDALGGDPGVFSARFAGENATYRDNRSKLLQLMAGIPEEKRGARFRALVALIFPDGRCETVDGVCSGLIITEERGTGGFGYDPIFLVPEFGKTLAEMTDHEKNAISHRGKAFRTLKELLLTMK